MPNRKTEASNQTCVASAHLLQFATDMASAYLSHNYVQSTEVGTVLKTFHASLRDLRGEQMTATPAVPIKNSIGDDFIVCLEDGKRLKTMKRYLKRFDLTPETYRAKWNLPRDYPMVAPAYSRKRSAFAKHNGLGKSRRAGHIRVVRRAVA